MGSAIALIASYCAFLLHFNLPTAGFIELLIIVLIALRLGFQEATGCSFVAVGCLDYFFAPPIHSFRVADPKNWVSLLTFEIIALIVSRLSARLRNEMRESLFHRGNAEKLYELSRSILILDRRRPVGPQIARLIEKHIGLQSVAIFDGSTAELFTAGACTKEDEELARTTFLLNGSYETWEPAKWNRVLRLQSRPIGAIVISAVDLNPRMVDAVASLVAVAFERLRSFENESRAEAARQAEQLRTTVLDGLAHAFKTPLTVILASTSGLCEMKCLAPAQEQLVQLIDEHARQLNTLTSHMLQMAKLDSKEIHLCCEEVFIAPFIRQVVDDCAGQLGGRAVPIWIEDEDLAVSADRQLLAITITELLLNAAKYSNADSPISIFARNENRHAVISVHNDGPVIEFAERELIFARFYRGAITKHRASGNGIGLSVAKRTAQAHDGRIWVNSSPQTGTTFFLSLPVLARSEYADITE